MTRITSLALTLLVFWSCEALASDWKFGGSLEAKGGVEIVFYDAGSVVRTNASVRFWTESIPVAVLTAYGKPKQKEKELIEAVARKIASGYIPPFLILKSSRALYKSDSELMDKLADAVYWEIVANDRSTRISSRFCFEIKCVQKMIRTLEGDVFDRHGLAQPRRGSFDQTWRYIPPDTNSASWAELFCSR